PRSRFGAQGAGQAQPPAQARRRRRGPPRRRRLFRTARRPRPLDDAAPGRPAGRAARRGLRLRRDRPAHASKNEIKPWLRERWRIPPEANAEFVCNMEDVLDVYHRPEDESRPVVCLDEASRQLIGETAQPVPAAPGRPERVDYEYVRNGTANLFMVFMPLL